MRLGTELIGRSGGDRLGSRGQATGLCAIFLTGYDVNAPTWFYLSSLLIVAVFFRFGRIWSLRNIDVFLLLSLAPGLLMVGKPQRLGIRVDEQAERYHLLRAWGTTWLFAGAGLVFGGGFLWIPCSNVAP
ncbi:MAG: hypothetical protein Ct9H300mP1_24540 [Planctomycetaceae bacterium]|nr:MAG: hypothetical protein Ct9H300mP1_24540 [Planctomycetaceae bacterium]